MTRKLSNWKPQKDNLCYVNYKDKMSIAWDEFQWILRRRNTYHYYGTMEQLFTALFENEVREITGKDLKTLLPAINKVKDHLKSIVKDIKLPGRDYEIKSKPRNY